MAKKPLGTKPRKRLSVKQQIFAEEFVKSRGNGTKSALAAYETTDPVVASSIATENLNKPLVRLEILHLLKQNQIDLGEILGIHRRNMLQEQHLPTSQKAVGDFYEILGLKSQDKPSNEVKIAFVIEK